MIDLIEITASNVKETYRVRGLQCYCSAGVLKIIPSRLPVNGRTPSVLDFGEKFWNAMNKFVSSLHGPKTKKKNDVKASNLTLPLPKLSANFVQTSRCCKRANFYEYRGTRRYKFIRKLTDEKCLNFRTRVEKVNVESDEQKQSIVFVWHFFQDTGAVIRRTCSISRYDWPNRLFFCEYQLKISFRLYLRFDWTTTWPVNQSHHKKSSGRMTVLFNKQTANSTDHCHSHFFSAFLLIGGQKVVPLCAAETTVTLTGLCVNQGLI